MIGPGIAAVLIAAPFAPLLSRYRGIFFAMLTLALSMVTYGLLMKLETFGGSDGFNLGRPTLLGQKLPDDRVGFILFLVTVGFAVVMAALARIYFDSTRGLVTLATRENELRVEYLGGSVRHVVSARRWRAAVRLALHQDDPHGDKPGPRRFVRREPAHLHAPRPAG